MTKFDQKSFSTPSNSQAFRDNFEKVFGRKDSCLYTDQPCGGVLAVNGSPCSCDNCVVWAAREGLTDS